MKPSPRLSKPLALLALASLAALGACDPEPASLGATTRGMVGGQPDTDFPAAVALTLDGAPFCSGVLLGPRTVLTSAACLDDGSSRLGPGQIEVFFGEQVGASGQSLQVAEVVRHPDYSPETPELHNLAALTLTENAPAAPLGCALLDGTSIGSEVWLVGFGVTNASTFVGSGERRVIDGRIESLDAHQILAGSGPCYGDSGGPMLLEQDGMPMVVGVLSTVDADCSQWSAYTRLDAEIAFIRSLAEPPDAGEPIDAGSEEPDAGQLVDAGVVDAGSELSEDAGAPDAGSIQPKDAGQDAQELDSAGCGCASGASGLPAGAAALALVLLARRRRPVTG